MATVMDQSGHHADCFNAWRRASASHGIRDRLRTVLDYLVSLEWHGTFEGGGFGVGADVDLSGMFRLDWKPISHFGIAAGYNILYFKVTDTLRSRTFEVTQTMHGPILGIGFYF